ncbi:MAG: hypothetical protein ACMG6S_15765 [Byssovorax sp.]
MRRPANRWIRLGILLVAVGLPSSCLLTSSFDDLTGGPIVPATTSSSGSSGGQGGSSTVSSSGTGGASGTSGASTTGGGASIPSTGVLDNFNRPDGVLGNSWLIDTPPSVTIASKQLVMGVGDAGVILWPTGFGANQEAFVTFKETHLDDLEIELIFKSQATSGECEALQLAYHPPTLLLYSCSAGIGTAIGDGIPLAFQAGDQLAGRALENGTVQAYKNGVLVGTWDASMWPDHAKGGRVGLGTYGLMAPNRFDNFGGGTLP